MFLKRLTLQNFRSYKKSEFAFDKNTVLIVGMNTSGKTNFIESIFYLSKGKSFKTDKDDEIVRFNEDYGRIGGILDETKLEVFISKPGGSRTTGIKKYMVNGVGKRRLDFMGNLFVVLFSPTDLDLIIGSPGLRRGFLNNILEAADFDYRKDILDFTKALRQRNALLDRTRETGRRDERQFEYWDSVLIKSGQSITKKREELINFFNNSNKEIFDFTIFYDKSEISKERLLQYKSAEVGAGVTLVGPHRDDFSVQMLDSRSNITRNVKSFGSRGQQRLVILQLKLFELEFIEKKLKERPILLLDDIFSELDSDHIKLVVDIVGRQQTIITTTHRELIPKKIIDNVQVIGLGD